MRCIVDEVPADPTQALDRQMAENAARMDLSAIARARAIQHLWRQVERVFHDTLVSGKSVRVETQGEFRDTPVSRKAKRGRPEAEVTYDQIDAEVARHIKAVTGQETSGRIIRNYRRLLTLPPQVQELAEAGGLTERQLRAVCALDDPAAQLDLVKAIITQSLSGEDAAAVVAEVEAAPVEVRQKVLRRAAKQPPAVQYGRRILTQVKAFRRMAEAGGFDDLAREWATVSEYQEYFDAMLVLEEIIQRVKAYRKGRTEIGLATQSKYAG